MTESQQQNENKDNAFERVALLMQNFPPWARERILTRILPGSKAELCSATAADLANQLLYGEIKKKKKTEKGEAPAAAAAAAVASKPSAKTKKSGVKNAAAAAAAPSPPPPSQKRPVKKALLHGDPRLTATSLAVNAASPHTGEKLIELVLARADAVLADSRAAGERLAAITPGFASGKHWSPTGGKNTTGSAAYSRFNKKYYALNYKTLVPLYVDERQSSGEDNWNQHKDAALAIEKRLHRHLKSAYPDLFIACEGGSEPGYSSTTRFYVYLALKIE